MSRQSLKFIYKEFEGCVVEVKLWAKKSSGRAVMSIMARREARIMGSDCSLCKTVVTQ